MFEIIKEKMQGFLVVLGLISVMVYSVSAQAQSCEPGSDCYNYSCNDGILHLNTDGNGEKLYLIQPNGNSVLLNTYAGNFKQNLATNSHGETFTIQTVSNRKVLTKLNADGTKTCIPNVDCSVGTGISGNVEALGFGYDDSLFAVDVSSEVIYYVNMYSGIASVYYNLKATAGNNAADGVFGIDFQGGDLVVTKNNQIIYVRFSDGAIYRIDLYFPTNRAFIGFLPNKSKSYTSLAQVGSTFYALESNDDEVQPFTINNDVLTVLPVVQTSNVGAGDASSCPEAPVNECQLDNILLNGGFEAVDGREGLVHGIPLSQLGLSGNGSWDVYGTLPDVTDGVLYSWFTTSGAGIEVQKNTIVPAHGGSHYVELDSHPNAQKGNQLNSTMTQFIGLNGGDYELHFWYRPRTINSGDNTIEVLVDNNVVYTADSTNNSAWVEHVVPLNSLPIGYYEISFRAAGTPNQLGGFLDDASLICKPTIVTPVCGNQVIESGEQCDDGNTTPLDGCSASCQIETPVCGNQVVESGEQCDDGNTTPLDGCSASCQIETPVCGNGVIEDGEGCDDGNQVDGDGCTVNCTVEVPVDPVCGNGVIEDGEGCDDGNQVDGDGCTANCAIETPNDPVCGNEVLEDGEECDDGNQVDGDGCTVNCTVEVPVDPVCGNGIIEDGEGCDDGNQEDGDGCTANCTVEVPVDPVCGNGVIEDGEGCDDGNQVDGDGCTANCAIETPNDPVCGNEVLEDGEECDDGNTLNNDGCSSVCTSELNTTVCGNGILEVGEICDDGNVANGDGCDAECVIEPTGSENPGDNTPNSPSANDVPDNASGDQPGSDCEAGNCDAVDDPAPQIAPVGGGAANQIQGSGASCSLNESPMTFSSALSILFYSLFFLSLAGLKKSRIR